MLFIALGLSVSLTSFNVGTNLCGTVVRIRSLTFVEKYSSNTIYLFLNRFPQVYFGVVYVKVIARSVGIEHSSSRLLFQDYCVKEKTQEQFYDQLFLL